MTESNDKTGHKKAKRCKEDKIRILRIKPTKKKKTICSNMRPRNVAKDCAAGDRKLNSPKSIDFRKKFQKYCLPPSSVQVLVNGFLIYVFISKYKKLFKLFLTDSSLFVVYG